MATTLQWLISTPVSCFHAAEALSGRQALADAALAGALAPAVDLLQAAFEEEGVPADVFWSHLIPSAARLDNHQELVEVALAKTIGRTEVPPRLHRFRSVLLHLLHLFGGALPELTGTLVPRLETLRRRWHDQGVALLSGVMNWTEPSVLVEEATVVLVYPAQGGGGSAHLPYNLARIEAVLADPVTELSEVLRLAWLVSVLNLDLPRYGEHISRRRLPLVAGLAMIPIALSAAESIPLAACDEPTLRLAVQSWLPAMEQTDQRIATLSQWWEVYRTMRPAWADALQALDRLLADGQSDSQTAV
jgi:hypothetical protein